MAGSINKVILIGNLGRDPEIRTQQGGSKIATLNLATSESWKDKNTGDRKEKTEWHRIVVFNERFVKLVESYVKKGHKLYVEGALQTRKWTDDKGVEKFSTEIVISAFRGEIQILGSGGNGESRTSALPADPAPSQAPTERKSAGWQLPDELDHEIPF